MSKRYYLQNIYTFLNKDVSDEKLRIFCYDQSGFKLVYDQLTKDTEKVDLIDRLVNVAQKNASFDTLLAWAEETHPTAYQKYFPYSFTVENGDEAAVQAPYRGLFAFREEDAPLFFGRETFVSQLIEAVQTRALITLIGPSGSGKSSVISAGLLPKLRQMGHWTVVQFRPGSDPFQALATALLPLYEEPLSETARLVESRRLAKAFVEGLLSPAEVLAIEGHKRLADSQILIIGDQFEELFTLCPVRETRLHFLDILLKTLFETISPTPNLAHPTPPSTFDTRKLSINLIICLRGDFFDQLLSYRPFADAVQTSTLILGPMTRAELKHAIVQPALHRGVTFEQGLVDRILDDVGTEPGNLPLLEFALTELWDRRTENQLRHIAYHEIGQVAGALSHYADHIYASLSPNEQARARRIFVQLIYPGERTEGTRRLARRADLAEGDWPLVQKLADARLVVTNRPEEKVSDSGQETVEIVHEVLIHKWDQLRIWMRKDRRFRTWQEKLRFAQQLWEENNREQSGLLHGVFLAEAEDWLIKRRQDLSQSEMDYINQSLIKRKRSERLRYWVKATAALGIALIAALAIFVVIAFALDLSLRDERISQRLVMQAEEKLDQDPELAMLLALTAWEFAKTEDVARMIGAVSYEEYAISEEKFLRHRSEVWNISWHRDGNQIASGTENGEVIVWDLNSGDVKRTLPYTSSVLSISWHPDGSQIASGTEDGKVIIWDLNSGDVKKILTHTSSVLSISWHRDGNQIASGTENGELIVWDVDTGEIEKSNKNKYEYDGSIRSISWSPNGKQLAFGGSSGQIAVWKVESESMLRLFERRNGTISSISWHPDGNQIASGTENGEVIVWDVNSEVATKTLIKRDDPMLGRYERISSVSWHPDGKQVTFGTEEGKVFVLDYPTIGEKAIMFDRREIRSIKSLSWHPDGKRLTFIDSDGRVSILNADYILPGCKLVSRNLSPKELETYLSESGYQDQGPCLNHT